VTDTIEYDYHMAEKASKARRGNPNERKLKELCVDVMAHEACGTFANLDGLDVDSSQVAPLMNEIFAIFDWDCREFEALVKFRQNELEKEWGAPYAKEFDRDRFLAQLSGMGAK
jgi:hypothetical protein